MANEFKVKKGLIVHGSGSTILDVRGSQGQLFSVTDNLSGSLFSVSDISGVPIFDVLSDATVEIGGNLTFSTGSRLILQSGSASAPALTFLSASATNNGIYREAYDTNKSQISISTEGTRRVRINEAGIFSDVNVYATSQFRSFASPWHATAGTAGAGFKFSNTQDDTIPMQITNSGSLTISGSGELTFLMNNNNGRSILINQGGGNAHLKSQGHNNGFALNYGDNTYAGKMLFYKNTGAVITLAASESAHLNIVSASIQKFYVGYDGDVGIGTDSPDAKLEIVSDGSAAGGAEIRLTHANNNSTDVVSTVNFANNVGSVAMIQGGTTSGNTNGYMAFFTDNSGTSAEKVRIISSGNVGIGTNNPGAKLHIQGSGSTELRIVSSTANTNSLLSFYEGALGSWAIDAGQANGNFFIKDLYNSSAVRLKIDNTGAATFSGSIIATGSITTNGVFTSNGGAMSINNGGSIAAYFNGTGTSYTQGAISIQSSNANTPEARGQGVYMYNQGKDSTWYMGTRYNNADEWQVGRASGSSIATAAATTTSASFKINNAGNATFNGKLGIGTNNHTSRLTVVTQPGSSSIELLAVDASTTTNKIVFSEAVHGDESFFIEHDGAGAGAANRLNIFGDGSGGTAGGISIARDGNIGIGVLPTSSRQLTVDNDIGIGNSKKIYLYHTNDVNYLKYNEWKQSASAGTEIKNIAGTGNISIGAGNTSDLLIVSASGDVHVAQDLFVDGGDFNLTKQNGSPTINMLYDGNNPGTNTLLHYFNFKVDYNGTHQDWGGIEHRTNASSVRTDLRFNVKSTSGAVQTGLTIEGQPSEVPHVGIATTSPGATLDVGGSSATIWVNPPAGNHAGVNFRQAGTFKGFVGFNNSTSCVNLGMDGSIADGINVNSSHNVGIGTTAISASLHVKSTASDTLLVEGSGSTIFDVLGSQGRLFSINDSLTGSLFTVSDISGVPILDVDSSDKVTMGTFGLHTLVVTGSKVLVGKSAIASTASLQVAGAISASGDLTIKGFTSVSASLAGAIAGGDNLGNHTATQALNMGNNNINSAGDISLGDAKKIKLGAAPDFEIHHDNSTNVNHISSLLDRQLSLNANMILFTNQANSATTAIVSGSNFGVGTTTPDGKLEVAGGTTLGLRISNAGDSSAYDQTRIAYSGYNSGAPEMVFMPLTTPGSGVVNTFFRFRNTNGANATNNIANVSIDGKLGVGTDSPQNNLHIKSSGNAELVLERDSGAEILLQAQSSVGVVGTQTNNDLDLKTNSTTRVRIKNNGNVGIGTTSPSYKLHIHDSNSGQYGLYITGKPQASIFAQSTNKFPTSVTGSAGTNSAVESNASHIFQMSGSTSAVSPSINLGLAASGSFPRSNVNQVVIQGSLGFATGTNSANILLNPFKDGRVGIAGYQNVEAKLHIVGGFTHQSGTDGSTIPPTSPTGSEANRANIRLSHSSYSDSLADNGKYATEFIVVDRSGNLPVYVRQSGGTANVFTNIVRFGHHGADPRKFAVFGNMSANQYYDGNNAGYFGDFASVSRMNSIWFADNSLAYNTNSSKGRGQLRAYSSKPFSMGSQASGTVVLSNETNKKGTFLLLGNTDFGNASELFSIYRANQSVGTPSAGSGTPQKILRLSGQGNLLVGRNTTHSSVSAQNYYAYSGTTFYLKPSNTGTSLNVAGDVVAFASSDIRMKEDIRPFENALEKLEQIKGIRFKWNNIHEDFKGKEDIGIIAQDVEKVIPEIVMTRETGYKAVDYKKLSVLLIESVKELKKEVEELKKKINN